MEQLELWANCEECDTEVPKSHYQRSYGHIWYICDECNEHLFCECGTKLEDAYGSPGDGFCIKCR